MKVTCIFTDTTRELRITAETPRDTLILDAFSNARQGGMAKVTSDSDGNLRLEAVEAKPE